MAESPLTTRNELMLTKEEIQAAVDESARVKEQYPSFWKFYEMVLEMNRELMLTQMEAEIKENPE